MGAAAEDADAMPASNVVVVRNLAGVVTSEMLEGTFEQIGPVLEARMEGTDWGWVDFENVGDAKRAVERFGRVGLHLLGR